MRCKICGEICRNVLHTTQGNEIYVCTISYTQLKPDLTPGTYFKPCNGIYDQHGKAITGFLSYKSGDRVYAISAHDLISK